MNFGISTNKALVVASQAVIESLLEAQLSQIHAAQTVADGQGLMAKGQALATIASGTEQASSTRMQSYSSLTQSLASSVGASFTITTLGETASITANKNSELDLVRQARATIHNTPAAEAAAVAGPGAAPRRSEAEVADSVAKASREIKNAKNAGEVEGILRRHQLNNAVLTQVQKNSLQDALDKKEGEIKEAFNEKKSRIELKNSLGQSISQSMNGLTIFTSSQQASHEASKSEQDALTQVSGAISQQTQTAYQQILDSRQNLAQEISKVLDSEVQALQAVGLRG